jgi:hypothetical protein
LRKVEVAFAPPDRYGQSELSQDFDRWLAVTTAALLLNGVAAAGADEQATAESHPLADFAVEMWAQYARTVAAGVATPAIRQAACRLAPAAYLILSRLAPADRAEAVSDGWVFGWSVGMAERHHRLPPDAGPGVMAALAAARRDPLPELPHLSHSVVCIACGLWRFDPAAPCAYCSPAAPGFMWGSRWSEFGQYPWWRWAGEELDSITGTPAAELVEQEGDDA